MTIWIKRRKNKVMKLTKQRKPYYRDPKRTERLREISKIKRLAKRSSLVVPTARILEISRLYEAEIRFLKSQVWKWK